MLGVFNLATGFFSARLQDNKKTMSRKKMGENWPIKCKQNMAKWMKMHRERIDVNCIRWFATVCFLSVSVCVYRVRHSLFDGWIPLYSQTFILNFVVSTSNEFQLDGIEYVWAKETTISVFHYILLKTFRNHLKRRLAFQSLDIALLYCVAYQVLPSHSALCRVNMSIPTGILEHSLNAILPAANLKWIPPSDEVMHVRKSQK